MKPNENYRVV
jgi:hypothetical protein